MTKRTAPRRVYQARDSFVADVDGVPVSFVKGQTRVEEGHEILKRFPSMFEPLHVHYRVEQATADPGDTIER